VLLDRHELAEQPYGGWLAGKLADKRAGEDNGQSSLPGANRACGTQFRPAETF